ncbi:hypothetical protein [Pseudomonas sp. 58 R 3]|nr:hypothetical protein [Pseudomonas sp. 58 R 3]
MTVPTSGTAFTQVAPSIEVMPSTCSRTVTTGQLQVRNLNNEITY